MVAFNFDANTVRPNVGTSDVLPSGVYDVQITSSTMKPTKDGSGAYLQLAMSVIAGEFRGASITERLNLQNRSPQAVEIAYGSLSAICHVTGVLQMQQTEQLHGRPFKVKVLMSPRQDDPSKNGNEIKGYFDINGNEPGAGGNAGPAGAPAPQAPPQPPQQPPQSPAQYTPASAPAPAPAPAPTQPPSMPAPQQQPAPATPPWAS